MSMILKNMDFPVNFDDLDWENINPLNKNYWNAIDAAIEERLQVAIAIGFANYISYNGTDYMYYSTLLSDKYYSSSDSISRIALYRRILESIIPIFVNHTVNGGDYSGKLYWDNTFYLRDLYGFQAAWCVNCIPCWTVSNLMNYLGYPSFLHLESHIPVIDETYSLAIKQIYQVICLLKWVSGAYTFNETYFDNIGYLTHIAVFPIYGYTKRKQVFKQFYTDSEGYLKPPNEGFAETLQEYYNTEYQTYKSIVPPISLSHIREVYGIDDENILRAYSYQIFTFNQHIYMTQPFNILYNNLDIYMIPTKQVSNQPFTFNPGNFPDFQENKLYKYKTINFTDRTEKEITIPEESEIDPAVLENGINISTKEQPINYVGYLLGYSNTTPYNPEDPTNRNQDLHSYTMFYVFKFDGPDGFKFRGTDW